MVDEMAALRVEYARYVKETTDRRETPITWGAWFATVKSV